LIVVVENNGYAEMTPSAMLTAVPAAARAAAYGIPGLEVDGDDPVAVASVVAQARARSLAEQVPVLIEAHTHRLAGHYSGDAQAYRPAGELAAWREHDPLLLAERALPAVEVAEIRAACGDGVISAFARATEMPAPAADTARDHVYS
jgi:TPP-dependent pyruvate/acetoin dehydrogenase alpha subunit